MPNGDSSPTHRRSPTKPEHLAGYVGTSQTDCLSSAVRYWSNPLLLWGSDQLLEITRRVASSPRSGPTRGSKVAPTAVVRRRAQIDLGTTTVARPQRVQRSQPWDPSPEAIPLPRAVTVPAVWSSATRTLGPPQCGHVVSPLITIHLDPLRSEAVEQFLQKEVVHPVQKLPKA
jgi:hypothetical protein